MNTKLKKVSLAALFSALCAVATAFVKVPTGINEGYVHFGDSIIYIAACLLGPIAAASAAIGGALADIIAGAAVWAPASAIIKALITVPFLISGALLKKNGKSNLKIVNSESIAACVISGIITVFGYYIAEGIIFSFKSSIVSLPFNVIQAVGSAIVFVLLGLALDAVKVKQIIK